MPDRLSSQPAIPIFLSRYLARVEGSGDGALSSGDMRATAIIGSSNVSIINSAEAARPAMNKLVVSVGKC